MTGSGRYDLVVIGSGPGGVSAAVTAASLGKRVAIVDRKAKFGGLCLQRGGVPSKALREAILHLTGFRHRTFYGKDYAVKQQINRQDLLSRIREIVARQCEATWRLLARHDVQFVDGLATFVDPHTLEINGDEGRSQIGADHIIICCGTRPAEHDAIPVDGDRVLDTDSLVNERDEAIAASAIVAGSGVIGLEYACMGAALGIQTTVVDGRDELLRRVDRDIVNALCKHLEELGVAFRMGEMVKRVTASPGKVRAYLESGGHIEAERLLYAGRRRPNTDRLALEATDLPVDAKGRLEVNEHFQTRIPHIYAAGDLLGYPALASTAIEQGRVAARHVCGFVAHYDVHLLPYSVYTIPEIATVGRTEQELKEEGIVYSIGVSHFADLVKGQLIGDQTGFLKLIFDPENLKVFGVHIIGSGAAELISIGHMAMMLGGTVDLLRDAVYSFPTLAQAYKMAAWDGMARLASSAVQRS